MTAAELDERARFAKSLALEAGAQHGYKNGQVTVLAPTGTIGFMMDCDTTGVEPDLALPGHPEVLVLGDMVSVRGPDGKPEVLPGVAPVAIQQGRYAGRLVRRRLRGEATKPFHYLDKGNVATIGRGRAVVDLGFLRLSGLPAWIVWLVVHIWYLVGFQNRLLVVLQWTFSFVTHGRSSRLIVKTPEEQDPPS